MQLSLSRKSLQHYTARRRQQIIDFVFNDIPSFPGVKVKDWYILKFPNENLIRQTFTTLLLSGRISRVAYKWQWEGHMEFFCKNPTPEQIRVVIQVHDICPLYRRKIYKGYARPPKEWNGMPTEDAIKKAMRRGGFSHDI